MRRGEVERSAVAVTSNKLSYKLFRQSLQALIGIYHCAIGVCANEQLPNNQFDLFDLF
jgi:hypothetical protein